MFKNIVWDLVGKFGNQIVSFGITIILTRLLSPEQYGIMGMALVITSFAHVFLDLGFNRAIIQHSDVSNVQLSTVFYINAAIALLLTLLCYFLAGPLAVFYKQPLIRPVFRVVAVSFLLNGLNLVPAALLYKRLYFKINSIQTLVASVISGVIGVVMAYKGFGVWSLVFQSLIGSLLILIFNFAYIRWFPAFAFSLAAIKPLWKYGSRMFASGLLDSFYTRLDTFIIGKIFSAGTLGYYARAQSMDNIVRQFSANSILSALFPYIAKHQDDRVYLKELYQRYLHIISFVSIGMSGILFLIAKPLFTLLFTERWHFSAELFQLMSIVGFAYPVSALMCNIIAGVGNSSSFLRLEIYKRLIVLPVYIFGFLAGIKGFIICIGVMSFVSVTLNGIFAGRELQMPIREQSKIILSYFGIGVVSCAASYLVLFSVPVENVVGIILLLSFAFTIFFLACAYASKLKGTDIINISFKRLKIAFQ